MINQILHGIIKHDSFYEKTFPLPVHISILKTYPRSLSIHCTIFLFLSLCSGLCVLHSVLGCPAISALYGYTKQGRKKYFAFRFIHSCYFLTKLSTYFIYSHIGVEHVVEDHTGNEVKPADVTLCATLFPVAAVDRLYTSRGPEFYVLRKR